MMYVPRNFDTRTCVSVIEMCYRNRNSLAKTVKFTLEPFVELKKNYSCRKQTKNLLFLFSATEGSPSVVYLILIQKHTKIEE